MVASPFFLASVDRPAEVPCIEGAEPPGSRGFSSGDATGAKNSLGRLRTRYIFDTRH
jgi:hypothetical protein